MKSNSLVYFGGRELESSNVIQAESVGDSAYTYPLLCLNKATSRQVDRV